VSQSKLEADHDVADAMGGKTCASVGFGFGFTSDWIAKSCEFFKPIAGRRSAKPITFQHSNKNRFMQVLLQYTIFNTCLCLHVEVPCTFG